MGYIGPRTERVPVPGQLVDQTGTVHLFVVGVVHDVQLHRTAHELLDEVHLISIADIDDRYQAPGRGGCRWPPPPSTGDGGRGSVQDLGLCRLELSVGDGAR